MAAARDAEQLSQDVEEVLPTQIEAWAHFVEASERALEGAPQRQSVLSDHVRRSGLSNALDQVEFTDPSDVAVISALFPAWKEIAAAGDGANRDSLRYSFSSGPVANPVAESWLWEADDAQHGWVEGQ